jgi:hypothetical protein
MTIDLYTHVTEEKSSDEIEKIVNIRNNIKCLGTKIS